MFDLNGLQPRDYDELLYMLDDYDKAIKTKRRHPKVHMSFLQHQSKSPDRRPQAPNYFLDMVSNKGKTNGRFPLINGETRLSSDLTQQLPGKSLSERYSQAKLLQEISDKLQEYRERDALYAEMRPKNLEHRKLRELERGWDPDVKVSHRYQRLEPINGPGVRPGRGKQSYSVNGVQNLREQLLIQQNQLLQNLLYNEMLRNSNNHVLTSGNIRNNLYHPVITKRT